MGRCHLSYGGHTIRVCRRPHHAGCYDCGSVGTVAIRCAHSLYLDLVVGDGALDHAIDDNCRGTKRQQPLEHQQPLDCASDRLVIVPNHIDCDCSRFGRLYCVQADHQACPPASARSTPASVPDPSGHQRGDECCSKRCAPGGTEREIPLRELRERYPLRELRERYPLRELRERYPNRPHARCSVAVDTAHVSSARPVRHVCCGTERETLRGRGHCSSATASSVETIWSGTNGSAAVTSVLIAGSLMLDSSTDVASERLPTPCSISATADAVTPGATGRSSPVRT